MVKWRETERRGKNVVFWSTRKTEQKVREHSSGSTLWNTALASADSQH